MKKKTNAQKSFECLKCHHHFFADETANEVICPTCKSDNVRPITKASFGGIIITCIVFVIAVCGGYFLTTNYVFPNVNESTSDLQTQDTILSPMPLPVPALDTISIWYDPVVNVNDEYIYSFDAHCNLQGEKDIVYELLAHEDADTIQTNTDGKFSKLSPTQSGEYFLRVRVSKSELVSETKIVTGFVFRPEPVIQKMTTEEFEKLLKNQDASKNNIKIAKTIKFSFLNLKKDEKAPSNIQDIETELLLGTWADVKIEDITYNKLNQINYAKISISYP